MALVLRKAVLPKNISLLKWVKGRPLATAAKRTDATAISTAVPWQTMRAVKKSLTEGYVKTTHATKMSSARGLSSCAQNAIRRMRFCMSCPNLASRTRLPNLSINSSLCRTRSLSCVPTPIPKAQMLLAPLTQNSISLVCNYSLQHKLCAMPSYMVKSTALFKRTFSSKPCPCPCGCGCGCGCLPPPCNTPPKCIQYMTGYYYYPYGFWFCGPYHVSGTCCPCGPCSPGKGGVCCACSKCCCCTCCPGVCGVVSPQANPRSFSAKSTYPQPFPQVISQQTLGVANQSPASQSKSPFYYPSMQFKPLSETKSQPEPSFKGATARDIETQSAHVQNHPICKKVPPRRSVISKLFPFKSQTDPQTTKKSSCLICPYSTRSGEKPELESSYEASYSPPISLVKPKLRPVDPFPMYPKKYISGAYSRSFNTPSIERNNAQQKAINKFSGDECPPLENRQAKLSLEQRVRPNIKPGVFNYSDVPNYKKPSP